MSVTKFLDPKNDVAFKKIFGTDKNKDILIHFLNDMITFKEGGHIKEVTFLKPNQDPETLARKTSLVDILCKDENGGIYIVEMQVAKEKGFEKRAQYYASKAYVSQMREGGKYHDLKEIIFLAISDFVMFPNKKDYKSDHIILDKKSQENDLKDFSFTFLELPKFNKDIDHLTNMIEKWAYFFKHADETSEEDLHKIIGRDQVIKRAYQELNRFSWTEQDMFTYEQSEKYEGAYQASLEQKYDEGLANGQIKGLTKGLAEGLAKGKAEGLAEGLAEGVIQGKIEVAKQLLQQGMGVKMVSIATSLPEEKIQQIASLIHK